MASPLSWSRSAGRARPSRRVEEARDLLPDLARRRSGRASACGSARRARSSRRSGRASAARAPRARLTSSASTSGSSVAQHRVRRLERRPRLELEQRLGRAHRARVEGAHAPGRRAVEEERHVDRDAQVGPRDVVELEVVEPQPAVGDEPVVARRPPRRGRTAACTAGTRTSARGVLEVEQVAVLGRRSARRTGRSARCASSRSAAPRGAPARCSGERRRQARAPSATRTTPSASTSSGTGSRCSSGASTPRPARRTS